MLESSLARVLLATLKREWLLARRAWQSTALSLGFYALLLSLLPLSVSSDPSRLTQIAPGYVWVAFILASLLSLDNFLRKEWFEGSLEPMLLSAYPLAPMLAIKVLVYWVINIVPLILLTPLFGILLSIPSSHIPVITVALFCGSPALSFIGALCVLLTLGLANAGGLLSVLLLPLILPVIIFGSGVVAQFHAGLPISGLYAILIAMSLFTLTLMPLAMASVLRLQIE